MALSEHEQRLLAEMERNLYENEADIVTTLGERRSLNHTAIALGVIIALAGVITMLVGVYQNITIVGILGFAVLFTGVMVAVATPAKKTSETLPPSTSATPNSSSGSFMGRLNERWDRRSGGNNL
jgi:hypothetical protein